jgi:cyclopropane-fatty-acyl-phospholipid synthase
LFSRFDGHLALRLWDGTLLKLGTAAHHEELVPRYTLVCCSPSVVVRSMVLGRDPLRMAEAYFRGEIKVAGTGKTAFKNDGHSDHKH